ncbi:SLC13 family permease [Carnobacteriaceae bacterium zg-ZUI78]|nr:SLC13 family permease [Carnobacteriaceae bacterium zg-ZUI78]
MTRTKKSITFFSLCLILLGYINTHYHWQLFGIQPASFMALSVFVASLCLWLFVSIDWSSLLCIVSLSLVPTISLNQILEKSFGNSTFIFLLFTFISTYAINQTVFLKRVIAKILMSRFARSHPTRFIFAFLTSVLVLSSIISPTVMFMFVFPIYEEICLQFGLEKQDKTASYLLIAVFSTIAIGCAMTPINHVFAITAMGLFTSATHISITNSQYMSMAIPTGLLLYGILLLSVHHLCKQSFSTKTIHTLDTLKHLPNQTKRETWIVVLFFMMISLWILPEFFGVSKYISIVLPPMLTTIAMCMIHIEGKPLLNLSDALTKGVHWQSLFLVGATLVLGSVLSDAKVGIIDLLNTYMTPFILSLSPMFMILFFIAWAGIQTNFTSNLVTVSVVTTLAITIWQSAQLPINMGVLACFIGFMSSLAFATAPAMPYVAISIGSGWTTSKDTFLFGTWLLFWSIVLAVLIGYPLGAWILS